MLPLIVALFWLAVLTPWAVNKFRNRRSDKSIDHFHAEHEVMSRQSYSVAPARRLDEAYLYEEYAYEPLHEPERSRPRLTVVHDDDTYSTLEGRGSWEDWDRDYDYDEPRTIGVPPSPHSARRYAAYANAPAPATPRGYADFEPLRATTPRPLGVSMRVRRTRILGGLSVVALLTSGLALLVGLALLQYLAVLAWVGVAFYVAVAVVAVTQGYLEVSSLLGRRVGVLRGGAVLDTDEPADDEDYEDEGSRGEVGQWRRERPRYALG